MSINASDELVHVHQCSSCGQLSRPESFTARDSVRGILGCPACGKAEPLNFRVVPKSELQDHPTENSP